MPAEKLPQLFFFFSPAVLAGFRSSMWEHLWKMGEIVSLNACKMNINVLNRERSQCEMNGKTRECQIALPSVRGRDIHLRAKFRDILRYSVLQIPRALCLPAPLYLRVQLPPGAYQRAFIYSVCSGLPAAVGECSCRSLCRTCHHFRHLSQIRQRSFYKYCHLKASKQNIISALFRVVGDLNRLERRCWNLHSNKNSDE